MKYSALFAVVFAILAVSALAQPDVPVEPAVPVEPTAPGILPVEPIAPTVVPEEPTAAPVAPVAPVAPTPQAVLTPSTGTIFFTTYTAVGCPSTDIFFNATVRDDYAACQTITVAGAPAYVKIGCYSNNTITGATYATNACTGDAQLSFPLAASGTCTAISGPAGVKTFLGYCPDDAGNPANTPTAPSTVPHTPSNPPPSAATSVAFSGLLAVIALLCVLSL